MINYGTEDLEPPILSVEEAVKRSSFFEVPPYLYPKPVGDISQGMAEADHKIISAEVVLIYLSFLLLLCTPLLCSVHSSSPPSPAEYSFNFLH